ncbi:MAG: hypothetical protein QOG64_3204 [Acidimicrobiaceae bacterium]|nr:hypothetical protein [Acidimicrobiaceae bacterium]
MPVIPDDKDWTWVLERPCPECGFDAARVLRAEISRLILDNAGAWREVLARSEAALRARPSDDRWSPLEYACHVRDVFRLYDERLRLMLDEDDPTYANWDQDVTAVEARYNDQTPAEVLAQLAIAARQLADRFASVGNGGWSRTGTRSDGARFTVESFARYLVHDPVHHLFDVTGGRRPQQTD